VVLKAPNLKETERFYTEMLGFEVVNRLTEPRAVFFTLGEQHHDLGVFEVSPQTARAQDDQPGLHHVAWQVEDFATLKACYQTLKHYNVPIVRAVDHGLTKSIYFCDPAGNRLEIYCDVWEDGLERARQMGDMTLADFPPLNLDD